MLPASVESNSTCRSYFLLELDYRCIISTNLSNAGSLVGILKKYFIQACCVCLRCLAIHKQGTTISSSIKTQTCKIHSGQNEIFEQRQKTKKDSLRRKSEKRMLFLNKTVKDIFK